MQDPLTSNRDRNHKPRLLLAEDNVIARLVSLRFLERLGYTADVAVNGLEAVQMADQEAYDAILMDCDMPVLDGCTAAALIRRLRGPSATAPIIALTASTDRSLCLKAGMNDHLTKPCTLEEMRGALERWAPLSGGRGTG